ncbi:TrkA family potassium uptake protein [Psychromonas sp. RZ22]|uniref:potassium channel family protein n=1 Tax=Psychromonas algarum TaxID=2555643 RepID=UPI001068A117|nr:TrkA family potassium uptake protein [Psychromonas sp. RZ22]TEW54335.1 TrkA family potassium uptake protein [Psychromonas sp. RZ22]
MKVDKKQFAVIGLGRFGLALCEELMEQGAQVLALDIDEQRVKLAADKASHAIIADCSSEDTVAELKLDEYDIVVVAIGDDINTSILTTLVLKEMGTKTVWVKAKNKFHAKILYKIGADRIISPERDMGIRIARSMLDRRVFDFLALGSGLAIAEVVIGGKHLGERIDEHPCAKSNKLKILAYKRGATIYDQPDLSVSLEIGDILIVAGEEEVLKEKIRLL